MRPLGGVKLRQGSNTHNSEGMPQGLPSAVMVRLQGTGVGGGVGVCRCIPYNLDSCCSSSQEGATGCHHTLSVDSWAPMGDCWTQRWSASLLCPPYPGWNPEVAAEDQR